MLDKSSFNSFKQKKKIKQKKLRFLISRKLNASRCIDTYRCGCASRLDKECGTPKTLPVYLAIRVCTIGVTDWYID